MKQVIARISPVTNTPVIFDVSSRQPDGRINAFLNGKDVQVGYDFYMSTEHLNKEQSAKIAQAYAKHLNIPEHEIMVRQRFPKTNPKARKTNDSNLVLLKPDEKLAQATPAAAPKEQSLEAKVKEFHESEMRIAREKKAAKEGNKQSEKTHAPVSAKDVDAALKPLEELAAEHGKHTSPKSEASAANPEGATVKRGADERKPRAYKKKDTKRSEIAMKRYLAELAATASESPTLLEPVAHNATPEQFDSAIMDLAVAIAKILKTPGMM